MSKIIILCEGDTEELAIRHFVSRQWQAEGLTSVGLQNINLRGRLQDIVTKAPLFLDDDDNLAVFTLIDLYGMDRVNHNANDGPEVKVNRVRGWLKNQVSHRRSNSFFPHVSVHETKALILAEGVALGTRLYDSGIKADPEAEGKNFQKPPSKRINELFLKRRHADRYHKIVDGTPLFKALQFEPVYNSCRYFRSFYDDLRSIGRNIP